VLSTVSCDIDPPEGALHCTTDSQCPGKWLCQNGLCYGEPQPLLNVVDAGADSGVCDQASSDACLLDQPCSVALSKACSGAGLRDKLVCLEGHWRFNGTCDGDTRCSLSDSTRGTCQPIAPLCLRKQPGELICEAGARKRCANDLLSYEPEPCSENMHCSDADGVECVCDDGYVAVADGCKKDACPDGYARDARADNGCEDIDECASDANGCGAHRACHNSDGSFECGACDAGYVLLDGGCVDVNECERDNGGCIVRARKKERGGGKFGYCDGG
jgi:hypothetical protein